MERVFWLLAVVLIVGGLVFGFLTRRFAKGANEARRHGIMLGLSVEEVQRDVPYFTSNFRKPELRMELAIAYCLPHASTKASRWSFLQREQKDGARFPHGWELVIEQGQISEELEKALRDIATEWDEEYLEFECYPDKVCACWEEWGGAVKARRIHRYLRRISAAC